MRIELRLKAAPGFSARAYDPFDDDFHSMLMDTCKAMAANSEFLISGFGQDNWPVDIETDLPVLLAQLPSSLHAVREGSSTEIDFYEQGIERSIALSPSGEKYLATCMSRISWQPKSSTEEMSREELERMLLAAIEMFTHTLAEMAPDLAGHPWLQQWLEGKPETG